MAEKKEQEQAQEVKPKKESVAKKKKKIKNVTALGLAFIQATFNNTIVSICNAKGDVVAWSSSGAVGFKGTKKGTPFAAQSAAQAAAEKALEIGVKEVKVFVKGPGPGRETAIRALQSAGLTVKSIKDETPIPHNGCRPPKRRRV